MADDVYSLPPGLPRPLDDGAARHLAGAAVPDLSLPSTEDAPVSLARAGRALVVVFPSDAEGRLAARMRLPSFEAGGRRLLRRLTMLVGDGVVERVWYPVFPPDRHAEEVLGELAGTGAGPA